MLKNFPRYVTPNIKRADIDRAISILNIEKGNIVVIFPDRGDRYISKKNIWIGDDEVGIYRNS